MPNIGQTQMVFGNLHYWNGVAWVRGTQWDAQQFLQNYQNQLAQQQSKSAGSNSGSVGGTPPALDPAQTQIGEALTNASSQIIRNSPAPRINPVSPGGIPIWIILVGVLVVILIVTGVIKLKR